MWGGCVDVDVDMDVKDDGEYGGEALGRFVWEEYEKSLKTGEAALKEKDGGSDGSGSGNDNDNNNSNKNNKNKDSLLKSLIPLLLVILLIIDYNALFTFLKQITLVMFIKFYI